MSRLIDKQILLELKRMNKNGGGSGSGDGSDTPSSSAMVIEMEFDDELYTTALHPKTIPSEFTDEYQYWEYVRQFILDGGMVVFKYYAGNHMEAPENCLFTDLVVGTMDDGGDNAFIPVMNTAFGISWERPEANNG